MLKLGKNILYKLKIFFNKQYYIFFQQKLDKYRKLKQLSRNNANQNHNNIQQVEITIEWHTK